MGIITTVAGNGTGGYSRDGGPATAAKITTPRNIAVESAGNLYFAEQSNQIVRKVTAGGLIYTLAGNGTIGFSGDGGNATAAQFNGPVGVTCDDSGNVFIADWRNYRIRKVNASGIISTIAGTGVAGITGDGGPATAAHLEPSGNLGFDKLGNLICTDGIGNVIRVIDHSGTIYRIAGTGISGFSGDGGPATAATMKGPCATAINAAGDIYIVDAVNNRIRKITDYTSLLVGNTSSKNDFSIFPNPANSKITISSTQMIRKVAIYNLEGQVVYSANCFANNLPVDVSGLSNGIYLVKVNDSETCQFVKREQ